MSSEKTDSISLKVNPLFFIKLFCLSFSLVSADGPFLNFLSNAFFAAFFHPPSSFKTLWISLSSIPLDNSSNLIFFGPNPFLFRATTYASAYLKSLRRLFFFNFDTVRKISSVESNFFSNLKISSLAECSLLDNISRALL